MNLVRILFLAANPKDTIQVRISEEIRTIEERLRTTKYGGQFKVEQCPAVRVTDLSDALLRYRPQIVHFSGHGSPSGQIILEDKSGMTQPVSPEALSDLFKILKDDIQLVVLNACHTETQAQAIMRHVRCVICMSGEIDDTSAIAFAGGLYRGLGWGRSVATSFDVGCNEIEISSLKHADRPTLHGVDLDKMYLAQPDIPTESKVPKSVVTLESTPSESTPSWVAFIPFAVICGICIYLASWASEQLRYTLDGTSFAAGITVAAFTGFIWLLVNDLWSTIRRLQQPSPITTIRPYTSQEAANKRRAAALWAMVRLLVFAVVMIALIIWIVRSI